jgi:hypothetical protein
LPVVTPTEERLEAMLRGAKRGPDELIGNVPPMMEPATDRLRAGGWRLSCAGHSVGRSLR